MISLKKPLISDFGEFEFELKLVIATKDGVGSPPGLVNRFSDSIDVHYSFRCFFYKSTRRGLHLFCFSTFRSW